MKAEYSRTRVPVLPAATAHPTPPYPSPCLGGERRSIGTRRNFEFAPPVAHLFRISSRRPEDISDCSVLWNIETLRFYERNQVLVKFDVIIIKKYKKAKKKYIK